MERRPDYKDRDVKIENFSQRTTRKLGDSKEINWNS